MTATSATLQQARALAQRLTRDERRQLASELIETLEIEAPPEPTAASLLTRLQQSDGWAGDDLQERLADVYATRSPVEG